MRKEPVLRLYGDCLKGSLISFMQNCPSVRTVSGTNTESMTRRSVRALGESARMQLKTQTTIVECQLP